MTDTLLDDAWVSLLSQYNVLYVGFSGGLDSAALLHNLASQPVLFQKLHAVHINHGLSLQAQAWERHCEAFCETLAVPFSVHRVNIPLKTNLEERARMARHDVFKSLLTDEDGLLLAHHQEDQAETLLLNLMRGAGIDGMAAMAAVQSFASGDLLRPLLSHSRAHILVYAGHHGLNWVEDESNQDERFSRNFLRHRIMPLLQEKWPAAVKSIARGAKHCQQAKFNLEALAHIDSEKLTMGENKLSILALKKLTRERILNVLRVWLKYNGHQRPSEKTLDRVIDEVIFAREDGVPMVSFGEVVVRRYHEQLHCMASSPIIRQTMIWSHFPSPLYLGEANGTLQALPADEGLCVLASSRVEVRFRSGGERFRWRGQTKSLKKLLQQWQVPPWARDALPLIYVDDVLACVVGYAISDTFYKKRSFSQNPVTIQCLQNKRR